MIDSKNFTGPEPLEWRINGFVAYFKGKLYFLMGLDPKENKETNRVDVRGSNEIP